MTTLLLGGHMQGDGATYDTETIDAQARVLQGLRIGYGAACGGSETANNGGGGNGQGSSVCCGGL